MGYTKTVTVKMEEIVCGGCGIEFAVPEVWNRDKHERGGEWHCPNGCTRVYMKSRAEKAKEELAEERARHQRTIARLNAAEAEVAEVKRKLNQQKKRHSAGPHTKIQREP